MSALKFWAAFPLRVLLQKIVNGQVMNIEGKNISKEFTHGRKKNNENAKAKWESDLEFVRDFNLSKQKQINAKRIIFR